MSVFEVSKCGKRGVVTAAGSQWFIRNMIRKCLRRFRRFSGRSESKPPSGYNFLMFFTLS